MKKLTIFLCTLLPAISAFAYYGDYDYAQPDDRLSGLEIFSLIVMIVYIIVSIIILVRWWKMTADVKKIRQHITPSNPDLVYLIATGEKEKAQKTALSMLVDLLYPIYDDPFEYSKAEAMNKIIAPQLAKIEKLGLEIPDYVTSGEKFIDYLNSITGESVSYKE